jgi:hypothetical protein
MNITPVASLFLRRKADRESTIAPTDFLHRRRTDVFTRDAGRDIIRTDVRMNTAIRGKTKIIAEANAAMLQKEYAMIANRGKRR